MAYTDLDIVAKLLAHMGCASVPQLACEIPGPGSVRDREKRVRSALRKLRAHARLTGDWPRFAPNGDRIPAYSGGRYSRLPNFVDKVTLYRLTPWNGGVA